LSHPVALEEANDYAQRACELIFRSRYPWDVPFQAWALRVLFNCIWAQEGRSTDLLDRGSFVEPARQGPDQPSPLEEIGEEPQRLRRWESRDALRDAIRRLTSRAQQRVIVSGFWHGRSSAEIAQELGRTTQAVYNLRHRALNALREILSSQPDLFSR
jgi:RNA polymerase sigma factor (sigma-70 family)